MPRRPTSKLSDEFLARRFSIHDAWCCSCYTNPIRGIKYFYTNNYYYNLCDDCISYYDESYWFPKYFPWFYDVPSAPLSCDDDSVRDEVRHLQKILTELRYMSPDDTDQLAGSYRILTARAVREFRERYHIYGNDMSVYDQQTADKLSEVVH